MDKKSTVVVLPFFLFLSYNSSQYHIIIIIIMNSRIWYTVYAAVQGDIFRAEVALIHPAPKKKKAGLLPGVMGMDGMVDVTKGTGRQ